MRVSNSIGRCLVLASCIGLVSSLAFSQEAAKAEKSGKPAASIAKETKVRPGRLPDTYGTTTPSYYRISAAQFTPMHVPGHDDYSDIWWTVFDNVFARFSMSPGGFFLASPNLPSGALLTYLEFDSCDTNVTADAMLYLYDCDYHGDCGAFPVATLDSQNNFTPNACSYITADISGLGIVVDNLFRQLTLRAVTEAGDHTTSISGAIIGYTLQVSPAPLTATFPDVPTSDFGFQFVEALVASGITGGCGSGLYCPDAPVTRRQMAIFIAKALGLQFN